MAFAIVTDSSSNLTEEVIDQFDLHILPLAFMVDGEEHHSYLKGQKTDLKQFYTMMREGKVITTSLPNLKDSRELLKGLLASGQDVLYIGFSSGLSGTYQASLLAAQELKEKYPERTVECVDSLQASMGEGLLTFEAALLRKQGKSLDEVADYVRTQGQSYCAWFTVEDLMFLKRGGRVSGAAAVAGTLLGIKPVLALKDGEIKLVDKGRGRPGALVAMFKQLDALGGIDPRYGYTLLYSDNKQLIAPVHHYMHQNLQLTGGRVAQLGPTIGTHVGPGVVGVVFVAKE